MGKHKDKQALALIDQILRIGNEIGFISRDEYPVEGFYNIDAVWKLSEEDSPYVTFEIESKAPSNIFKNISKIFQTSTEILEKPRIHFIIIMKGRLSQGDRNALHNTINAYNITLIEDYSNSEKSQKKLAEALMKIENTIKGPQNKIKKDEEYVVEFEKYLGEHFKHEKISFRSLNEESFFEPYHEKIIPMIDKNEIMLVGKLFAIFYNKILDVENYGYISFHENDYFLNIIDNMYKKRPIMLNEVINNFGYLFMKYWIGSQSQKADNLAHLVLTMGIKYIEENIDIVKNIFRILDNISSDYFLPSLMAKQIILVSVINKKVNEKELVDNYCDWISINDEYAWDAEYYSYLRDSIYQAEKEQHIYKTNIEEIKSNYLMGYLKLHMENLIISFIDFLGDAEFDNDDFSLEIEYFDNVVSSYEHIKKDIISDIERRVQNTKDKVKIEILKQILDNSYVYKNMKSKESRFTLPYFVELFNDSNVLKFNGMGISPYGFTSFNFFSGLNEKQIIKIENLFLKYNMKIDEINSEIGVSTEVDPLWFSDKSHFESNFSKLLVELNEISRIKEISTGITIMIRDQGETKETA